MIVGAQKSGTSSLNSYLSAHPALQGTRVGANGQSPEIMYFLRPDRFGGQIPWKILYGEFQGSKLIGKSAGLMYEEAAVEQLAQHNPNAQIAVIMRDPVKRAYSSFLHNRRNGLEPESDFLVALRAGPERFPEQDERRFRCAYEAWGRYVDYLPRLARVFGSQRVHLFFFEEFVRSPSSAVHNLIVDMGVSPQDLSDVIPHVNAATGSRAPLAIARLFRSGGPLGSVRHLVPVSARHRLRWAMLAANRKAASDPPIPEEARTFLRARYQEPNRELSSLMQRDVRQWWGEVP